MKTIQLPSAKTGRLHTLSPAEVLAFYTEHWLDAIHHIRADLVRRWEVLSPRHFTSHVPMVGTLLFQLFDEAGEFKLAQIETNLVVDTGRAAAIDRLQAAAVAVHDYLAIGTGAVAPDAANTTLGTEVGTRVQGTLSQPTAYTDRCVGTFAAGNGTATITEAGRFNASSSGNLFCRATFGGIAKAAGDSLQITYDITD